MGEHLEIGPVQPLSRKPEKQEENTEQPMNDSLYGSRKGQDNMCHWGFILK